MNLWAVAYIVIQVLSLGIIAAKHGQVARHNFWAAFLSWILLTVPILYMAGAFHA